jgi:hypothetical protein
VELSIPDRHGPRIIDVMNQEDENDEDIFGDDEEQPC